MYYFGSWISLRQRVYRVIFRAQLAPWWIFSPPEQFYLFRVDVELIGIAYKLINKITRNRNTNFLINSVVNTLHASHINKQDLEDYISKNSKKKEERKESVYTTLIPSSLIPSLDIPERCRWLGQRWLSRWLFQLRVHAQARRLLLRRWWRYPCIRNVGTPRREYSMDQRPSKYWMSAAAVVVLVLYSGRRGWSAPER